MSKISILTLQSLEFLSLNTLIKLKNYFSYNHYLKKQAITKEKLEGRINNSIDKLRDIRIENSSTKKLDKIKECEYELHKILQSDVNISNKKLIDRVKVSKASFKAFSKVEHNFDIVETSLQELNSKSEIEELDALEEYINCLYITLNKDGYYTYFKNFEKNYKGTVTCKNFRKNRIKTSNKNEKRVYFNSVLNKLIETPPEYNIDCSIVNKNYKIKNKENKINYKRGPIKIECLYAGKVLDSLKINKKPNIACYVADEISTPYKRFIKNFTRRDKLLFSYSICEEKLYQSPHINSDIYSRYFDPEKSPLDIEEIMYNSKTEVRKNV